MLVIARKTDYITDCLFVEQYECLLVYFEIVNPVKLDRVLILFLYKWKSLSGY